MKCPKCKKEIKSSTQLENIRAEESSDFIEVKAECQCGQQYYTSFRVDDLIAEEAV